MWRFKKENNIDKCIYALNDKNFRVQKMDKKSKAIIAVYIAASLAVMFCLGLKLMRNSKRLNEMDAKLKELEKQKEYAENSPALVVKEDYNNILQEFQHHVESTLANPEE